MGHCPLHWIVKDFEPQYIRIIYLSYSYDRWWHLWGLRLVYNCGSTYTSFLHLSWVERYPRLMQTPCVIIQFMQHSIVNYLDYQMTVEAFKRIYAPTLYPIFNLDKLKVWFSKILSPFLVFLSILVHFCPPFGISVHYCTILSNFCTILSAFWYFCPLWLFLPTFVQLCPPLVFLSIF